MHMESKSNIPKIMVITLITRPRAIPGFGFLEVRSESGGCMTRTRQNEGLGKGTVKMPMVPG